MSHWELSVQEVTAHELRPRFRMRLDAIVSHAPASGFNRAQAAVIELAILSQEFDVEIASINVQDLRVDRFNEGRPRRVILVYSGIHYDTIAFVPAGCGTDGGEDDVKLFDARDEVMLEAARRLCGELRKKRYYTDTQRFDVKCNLCGWKGAGERGAVRHAEETGHVDFGEAT